MVAVEAGGWDERVDDDSTSGARGECGKGRPSDQE